MADQKSGERMPGEGQKGQESGNRQGQGGQGGGQSGRQGGAGGGGGQSGQKGTPGGTERQRQSGSEENDDFGGVTE